MSYFRNAGKGLRQDKDPAGLANVMGDQGNHPKHKNDYTDITEAMKQGDHPSMSKGSTHKSLGGVMQQGGGKHSR